MSQLDGINARLEALEAWRASITAVEATEVVPASAPAAVDEQGYKPDASTTGRKAPASSTK